MKKKRRSVSIYFSAFLVCLLLPTGTGICQGQPILPENLQNSFSLLSEPLPSSSSTSLEEGERERKFQISSGEKITSINFNNHSPLTPYVGAGIGDTGWSNDESPSESEIDSPAYRLGAGLDCDLSDSVRLSVCYLLLLPGESAELGVQMKKHHLSLGFHKCF